MSEPQIIDAPVARNVAEIKRAPLIVQDQTVLLDTAKFEQIQRVAAAMASMKLIPPHLRGSPSDCMMVVEQAWRWQMSPTAVASKTFEVGGKLAYEGQLVAAVVNTRAGLRSPLNYRYEGKIDPAKPGEATRKVTVFGTLHSETEPREAEIEWRQGFAMSKGARDKWLSQPDQQLAYFGARVWARRHCPEVLLGVYTPEEIDAEMRHHGADNALDVTPPRPTRNAAPAKPIELTESGAALDPETGEVFTGDIANEIASQSAAPSSPESSGAAVAEPPASRDATAATDKAPEPGGQIVSVDPTPAIMTPNGKAMDWPKWSMAVQQRLLDAPDLATIEAIRAVDRDNLNKCFKANPDAYRAINNTVNARKAELTGADRS